MRDDGNDVICIDATGGCFCYLANRVVLNWSEGGQIEGQDRPLL